MPKLKTRASVQDIPARTAEGIRALIAQGDLGPGVHLRQVELAKRFCASRIPIREALRLLVSEGLVYHDANRGFFVASILKKDAIQLYRLRHWLEHELMLTLSWPNKEQLKDLRSRVLELTRLVTQGLPNEWARSHHEFRCAIFALSDQKLLVREALRLWINTQPYRSLLPPRKAVAGAKSGEHSLVEALATRDRKALLRIIAKDRKHVEQLLVETFDGRNY